LKLHCLKFRHLDHLLAVSRRWNLPQNSFNSFLLCDLAVARKLISSKFKSFLRWFWNVGK